MAMNMFKGKSNGEKRGRMYRRRRRGLVPSRSSTPRAEGCTTTTHTTSTTTNTSQEEGALANQTRPQEFKRVLRLTALFPFALSLLAFVLTLIVVSSGTKPGYLEDFFLLNLNTTALGQDIIIFAPANSSTDSTSNLTAVARDNPLDPLTSLIPTTLPSVSLPGLPSVSIPDLLSFFTIPGLPSASLPSITLPGLTSVPVTGAPQPTETAGSTGSTPSIFGQAFLSLLLSAFQSLLSGQGLNKTTTDALDSAEATLIGDIITLLGLKPYYSLHVGNICSGNFENPTDPDSAVDISSCRTYPDVTKGISNIGHAIPSSFVIASTNISIPLIARVSSIYGTLNSVTNVIPKFIFAILLLSLISSGLSFLLALASVFLPKSRPLFYTSLTISSLSVTTRLIDAVAATIVIYVADSLASHITDILGVEATVGRDIIIFIWLGFVCALLTYLFWLFIWFVEFRTISFRVRRRTGEEVGDYRGIWQEVLSDVKLKKREKRERALVNDV